MTERLNNEEIEAISKRAEAATEGQWQLADTYDGAWVLDRDDDIITGTVSRIDDAKFIVNARADIPKLLAEISYLRTSIINAYEDIGNMEVWPRGGMRYAEIKSEELSRIRSNLKEVIKDD